MSFSLGYSFLNYLFTPQRRRVRARREAPLMGRRVEETARDDLVGPRRVDRAEVRVEV